jgi:hypothetical protein
VYACSEDELIAFSAASDFFRSVLDAAQVPADELLAATVRAAARARGSAGHDYLVAAGRELASLLANDFDRLTALLRRIRP